MNKDETKEYNHCYTHLCDLKPQMQIKRIKLTKLYKKAFLERKEKNTTEFSSNRTTWD